MLLSACIIARDEAAQLPGCLASLAGIADEIVVYDTGSVDSTVEVASQAGARVICGEWPGGFAAARNSALDHCRGEWVLSIDADENLACDDPGRLRAELSRTPGSVLALQVPIDNLTGAGTGSGYTHVADRLLRRGTCRWRGRLHEQLVTVGDGTFPPVRPAESVRLKHRGYLRQVEDHKGKIERNLRLAQAEVDDPSLGDRGVALVWLGRALWAADRSQEALERLQAGARTTANPTARRQGLESAARIALRLDLPDLAGSLIAELRAASVRQAVADLLEAGLHLAQKRYGPALQLLEATGATTGTVSDDDGRTYRPQQVLEWQAAALLGLDRAGEAADLILGNWSATGTLDADLDLLVHTLERSRRSLHEIAVRVQAPRLAVTVASALRLPPASAATLLESLWLVHRQRPDTRVTVLAGAAMLGRFLEPDHALEWSRRLRHEGLDALCPLGAVVADRSIPPSRRLRARRILQDEFAAVAPPPLEDDRTDVIKARPQTPRPALSVVMLARGGAEQVLGCLESLAGTLPTERAFEVVVVDPGTTDATRALLESLEGDVTVIRADPNPGPARARNLGWERSCGDVIVFVESNVRFSPGWAQPVLAAFESDPSLGAAGPLVASADRDFLCAGAMVRPGRPMAAPASGLAHRPWRPEPDSVVVEWVTPGDRPADQRPLTVDALADPVVAVRRSTLQQVGGVDEGYWGGGDLVDLCFAVAARGLQVACVTSAEVTVTGGPDPDVAAWTGAPADQVGPGRAAGPTCQFEDNRSRFATRWFPQSR